ncbi:MAG TPA: 2-isopropylmalate synthase [Kouleothrix sp.]|nr:2-isopropylmalate synthase [Kouleothrix sp.]
MEPHVTDHVRIFDTTLRDGEQAPGCTMTKEEKLEVARQLARLKVDIIEAGFPAASPGDWDAVNTIAREIGTVDGPTICGLARANKDDIDKCWSAIEPAAHKRIHTFMSTSDIHLEHQFRKSRGEALELIGEMVTYARSLCDDVEFSPMDAGRSDPQFLKEVLKVAIECGATTLNIPDTVGYTTPEEYYAMIDGIRRNVPGADKVIISTHCHDDLGMAVANSLAGVRAGARQIECTINGIGERAGNASLEEVVMALHTRQPFFGIETNINTRELARASRLVSACTGVHVPPNKAIVGANAFAHESGIHQDGVLKNRQTYEIMSAETVGLDGNALILGKHSGRHAFRTHLEGMGIQLNDDEFRHVFTRFKELADKKKVVDDRDIEALVAGEAQRTVAIYELEYVQAFCGTNVVPTATVRMRGPGGETRTESAQGTGPVDAVSQAGNKIVGRPGELVEFAVNAITEGINATAEVTIRVQEYGTRGADAEKPNGKAERGRQPRVFSGYGVNTDTVVAAGEAYVAALNKLFYARQERQRAGSRQDAPIEAVDLFGNSMLGKAD